MNPAIKTAINIVGSQKKLGAACEVSQQAVYKWLHNKAKVPNTEELRQNPDRSRSMKSEITIN
ncbi:YdaS family helix-turn-helix protein [Escherichia coli]|uniref:transcriptional regulator n=1 Tax=Escherichia coli TaxID=562 RepID=UPI000B2F0941|nr:YdaS family helix-turn-helix protein [Escherichia coli]MCE3905652.1 helix-turn-helix domain-containing protein [Escherichia coli]MCS0772616.1 helix-turn-helix domain-containing protein [Escherichia coli]MDD9044744.1 helix-turn-helix domain-containing protein [Escherichia coli]MDV0838285.1 YdaS family helix-turn-helix protein [Escherichia coli]MEB7630036.1 helix-turn-helix domain-containing protein [Escherichia coli]